MRRSTSWFDRMLWASSAWALLALAPASLSTIAAAHADDISVAVAANFLGTLQKLGELYERTPGPGQGHKIQASPGSSGQLYAQIQKGAPYDILLSADTERPAKLEAEGLGVKGSRFTYATGRLVLWSPKPGVVDAAGNVLKKSDLKFVSLADPKTAPYGVAAEQVLTKMELLAPLRAANKIVQGESVGQAHQFAVSGHADVAFVALSQVIDTTGKIPGSSWVVPDTQYTKLDQDAVLLKAASKPKLAEAFLKWLRTDKAALELIRTAGYVTPSAAGSAAAASKAAAPPPSTKQPEAATKP